MRKIQYTPDAANKLRLLKENITLQYGPQKANKILRNITNSINLLSFNEFLGPSVEKMFGIPTNYRYIFTSKNYIFYTIDTNHIHIINIYNEKEDFIWPLFGLTSDY